MKESTLERMQKIKDIPPYPKRQLCIGEAGLDRTIRLRCYVAMLEEVDPVSNAEEALFLVQYTIEHIEDLYSGLQKEESGPTMPTPRMYSALQKYITVKQDGGITVKTRGNRIEIDANGGFTIFDRTTDEIWLKKDGA